MGYDIIEHHGAYNIQRRTQTVRYIVVHYVGAGSSAPGNALANCRYFAGGNRNASAHYFIDDAGIYEYADPSAYATWHCGDGHGRYGITNGNSVGIEVCNNGGPYTEAETDRLAWLVQRLMARFGVPASCVVRHYDASRKLCPLYYAQNPSAWRELHARITGGAVTGGEPSGPGGPDLGDTSWTGPMMVSELERQLGTTVDGVISGQSGHNRSRVLERVEAGCLGPGSGGSDVVRALQRAIGADADGHMGEGTVAQLQRWLAARGWYSDSIDGHYGPNTSRGLGLALKAGAFRG